MMTNILRAISLAFLAMQPPTFSGTNRCQRQWRYIMALLLSLWLVVANAYPSVAQQAITWEDLQPQTTTLQNPYEHLSTEQVYDLSTLVRLQLWLDQNPGDAKGLEAEEIQRLRRQLGSQGLDVDSLLAQVDQAQAYWQEQSEMTNSVLAGQSVELSGYALPLTWNNHQQITEFLLVPFVGACIHVPPPPPNQIVHVEPPAPVEPPGLFAPVSVTGQLWQQPASYELFRVDGSRFVDVGYALSMTAMTLKQPRTTEEFGPTTLSQPIWKTLPIRVSAVLTKATGSLQSQHKGAFILGLLMAFSYGVLHTLGPGHGKAVIVSYFIGKGGSLRRGLTMGVRIAIFHVMSAIIVVLLTDTVIRQAGGGAPENYQLVQLISYGAIATIGAWLLRQSFIAKTLAHKQDKVPEMALSPNLTQHVLSVTPKSQSNRFQCQCTNCDDNSLGGWLSLAVGAVPCSGALLVLLYGLANNLIWPSILMVIAISIGMAITLGWIGSMAIIGRKYTERRLGQNHQRYQRLTRWIRIFGASSVLLIGLGLFGVTLISGGLLSVLL